MEERFRMSEFIIWMNDILSQLVAPSLSTFSLHYEMSERAVYHINQWVSFAFDHDVESLHLHLRKGGIIESWVFPPIAANARRVDSLKYLHLGGCKLASSFVCFRNLKLVSLCFVVATRGVIEDLLSNCVLLEDLLIGSLKSLTMVTIPSSLTRLKILQLHLCDDLELVQVNTLNLSSFLYMGGKVYFLFDNVTKLHLLRVGWLDDTFIHLLLDNPPLHTLILDFDLFWENFDLNFKFLPTLSDLKVLIMSVASLKKGFPEYVNFLGATPYLNKLALNLKYYDYTSFEPSEMVTEGFHHEHLKEIQMTGFSGKEAHMELAFFLIESAVVLDKITVIPCMKGFFGNNGEYEEPEEGELDGIKLCFSRISRKLSPGIKLDFLY